MAQLVARFVRDEEAVGSSPASPTRKILHFAWSIFLCCKGFESSLHLRLTFSYSVVAMLRILVSILLAATVATASWFSLQDEHEDAPVAPVTALTTEAYETIQAELLSVLQSKVLPPQ